LSPCPRCAWPFIPAQLPVPPDPPSEPSGRDAYTPRDPKGPRYKIR
jgi:hypothetical protein